MSSEAGSDEVGPRARAGPRRSPAVSSTASVVCVRQATGRDVVERRARGPPRRWRSRACCAGASPTVPSTSSWSAWPTSTIWKSSAAKRRASAWTLATSGQVASITSSSRAAACSRTAGETPWAEKITVAPVGHLVDARRRRPRRGARARRRRGRCGRSACARRPARRACSSARSTISTARVTPAQDARGAGEHHLARAERRRPAPRAARSPRAARGRPAGPRPRRGPDGGSRSAGVSSTTRSVVERRARASPASHADSMSTASAPDCASSRRRAPKTRPLLETIGPMWTRIPPRAQHAGEDRRIRAGRCVRSAVRSSLASTTSPGSSSRRAPPHTPAISAGRRSGAVRQRAAAARARRGPMPIFSIRLHGAPARIARASTRIGASTSSAARRCRAARRASARAHRAHRASAMIGKTTR